MSTKEAGKTEIVARITANTKMNANQANAAYDAVMDAVIHEVSQGNKVILRGLGTFSVKEIAARIRNKPGTGEKFESPASKTVKFTLSEKLKRAVRGS